MVFWTKYSGSMIAMGGVAACGYSPSVPNLPVGDTSEGSSSSASSLDATSQTSADASTTASDGTGTLPPTTDTTSSVVDDTTGEPSVPVCGNGELEGDEACDDGVNDGSYGGCAVDCSALGPHCGDGELDGPEPCDDGNDANGDGCNLDCSISGSEIWTRSFAGAAGFLDQAGDVAIGPDDGPIVAGGIGTGQSDSDVLLLAYDSDGSLLWNETHDFGDDAMAWGVAVDAEGRIGIAGDESGNQVLAAMFDPDGVLSWSDLFADVGGADLGARGAAFDDSGDLYVVGQAYVGGYDISVRRYSEAGALVWAESYDGGLSDTGFDLAIAGESLFVAGGTFVSASDTNGWIRRYDLDGSAVWTREFAGEDEAQDQAWAVAVDPTGGVVLAGISIPDSRAPSAVRPWIRKYDLDGATQWTVLYDVVPTGAAATGVAVDGAGQIAVSGVSDFEALEGFVAKHAPDGTQLWIDHPHEGAVQPPGAIPIRGIAIDSQSNIVVAGSLDGDVWVRKYAP